MTAKLAACVVFRYLVAKLPDKARQEVIDLLAEGKGEPINDKKIHDLADKLKMSPHDLESEIYAFASQWAVAEKAKDSGG